MVACQVRDKHGTMFWNEKDKKSERREEGRNERIKLRKKEKKIRGGRGGKIKMKVKTKERRKKEKIKSRKE